MLESFLTVRAQEVTPHKLQLGWDTLRWFAKKFGPVQEEHRLLQKKLPWDRAHPSYSQPGKPKYT